LLELRDPDVAELRLPDPEIADSEGHVGILREQLREQLGSPSVRREGLADRLEVARRPVAAYARLLSAAVDQELRTDGSR
jgi:hypothetical protein